MIFCAIEGYLSPERLNGWRDEHRWVVDGLPTMAALAEEVLHVSQEMNLAGEHQAKSLREALLDAAWLGNDLLSPQEVRR